MKIIADENMPWVKHYFKDALLLPGRAMTNENLKDADILLVRSVTLVNEALLKNTAVKFVGSVTTGLDHLDLTWLDYAKIGYAISLGFNAVAVAEYVLYVIAYLQKNALLKQDKLSAAVIGVGRIGSLVAEMLKVLGVKVVLCDPFRASESGFQATPLDEIQDVDFITLHTPLTKNGPHPTFHLIQKNFLGKQKPGCVLLNTCRGSVISFADLKKFGRHLIWCLDVWENEPNIDLDILAEATIATPHIAGYSIQSRYRGIEWIYQSMVTRGLIPADYAKILTYPTQTFDVGSARDWREILLELYNPEITTLRMKLALTSNPHQFDELRKTYPARCELNYSSLNPVSELVSALSRVLR